VRPSKSWDEFVAGWSKAFGGFDLRYASSSRRTAVTLAYRLASPLASFGVRPGSMTVLALGCWLAVPVIAWQRGGWPALAAVVLLVGLTFELIGSGLVVCHGYQTRLGSFYEALVERLSEGCWLIALLALGAKAWTIFAVGSMVWLHEYVRARGGAAEARPVTTNTVADRPMRVRMTIAALALAALLGRLGLDLVAGAVTLVVVSWMALALIGFGQLLAIIRKVLA
jgi:hypothetical protein